MRLVSNTQSDQATVLASSGDKAMIHGPGHDPDNPGILHNTIAQFVSCLDYRDTQAVMGLDASDSFKVYTVVAAILSPPF